jgi:membrane-bound metal-dependent hydrolase YbcI (DUF457 family)
MDNVTHTLFAVTLARTPLGRAGRGATTALILASNAPDIDIVATAGGALKYLEWHRGPTHGPLGIFGLGLVTAGLVWTGRSALDRWRRWRVAGRRRVPDAPFGMLALVSIIGVLLHVLMDLPTPYGTRVLSPFDWHWYASDWMPIVDVYLLMALAAGLFFGWGSDADRRRNVAIVLVFMTANYGVRAAAHERAIAMAPGVFGPLLPSRCGLAPARSGLIVNRWPHPAPPSGIGQGTRCLVEIAAMPDMVSPFRWRLIAQLSNAFEVRDVNIVDTLFRTPTGAGATWRLTLRYPNEWTPAVVQASGTRVAQVFLGFSRFPAARSFVDRDGVSTVRWTDVRYSAGPRLPGLPNDSRANLFSATVRIDAGGQLLDAELGSR